MAFITLSGTLLDPNGDLAVGDQIRFTHKSTTGETVQSAVSIITVNPAGTYSLPLQYGLVLVEYKDVRTQQFKNLGVATVNQDNPATSIPELLNALVPVSSAELIEFQGILADCVTAQVAAEAAQAAAEAAAATIDLINDLSQAYIFDTVALFKASLIAFPDGKTIHLNDRDADFAKITGTGAANTFNIIASTSVNQSIDLITISGGNLDIRAAGGLCDNVADDKPVIDVVRGLGLQPLIAKGLTSFVSYTTPEDMHSCTGEGFLRNALTSVDCSLVGGPNQKEDQRVPTPTGPSIRRQRTTTSDLEVFIDAGSTANGNGTQGNAFQSMNEAISMIPREIFHKVRLYIEDGDYSADEAWNLFNYFVTPRSDAGLRLIGHTPENPLVTDGLTTPSAVIFGDGASAATSNFVIGGLLGSDSDDVALEGVTINGRIQVYGSDFAFRSIDFKTGLGQFGQCIGGHSGKIKAALCDFSNCGAAANAIDGARFRFVACTGTNVTNLANVVNGSSLLIENSGGLISASGNPIYEGNSIIKIDGRYYTDGAGINGFSVGDLNNDLLRVFSSGLVDVAGAYRGGASAASDPGSQKFVLYMDPVSGDLKVQLNLGGVNKTFTLQAY